MGSLYTHEQLSLAHTHKYAVWVTHISKHMIPLVRLYAYLCMCTYRLQLSSLYSLPGNVSCLGCMRNLLPCPIPCLIHLASSILMQDQQEIYYTIYSQLIHMYGVSPREAYKLLQSYTGSSIYKKFF